MFTVSVTDTLQEAFQHIERVICVFIRINSAKRILPDIRIESQALRIGELCVWDRLGSCDPVGAHEAAHAAGVVPGPK